MGKIKTFLTILIFVVITSFSAKYIYAQEKIIQLDQEETIESVKEVENQETEEQEDTKTVETKEQTISFS